MGRGAEKVEIHLLRAFEPAGYECQSDNDKTNRFVSGRTWSATAMYDTSATETSSTHEDSTRHGLLHPRIHKESYNKYRRQTAASVTGQIAFQSDSGLGTTGMDYAQSGN